MIYGFGRDGVLVSSVVLNYFDISDSLFLEIQEANDDKKTIFRFGLER